MKVRTFGMVMVALMTVSTLAGVAGVVYQAASGPAAGATSHPQPLQGLPAAQAGGQPGDNAAVSAFKLVCPFH